MTPSFPVLLMELLQVWSEREGWCMHYGLIRADVCRFHVTARLNRECGMEAIEITDLIIIPSLSTLFGAWVYLLIHYLFSQLCDSRTMHKIMTIQVSGFG